MIRLSLSPKATEIAPAWGLSIVVLGCSTLWRAPPCMRNKPRKIWKNWRETQWDAVKIPLAESINFEAGLYGRTSSSLQIQPTIPFPIAEDWLLIPRVVATLAAYEPEVSQASGGSTGLGDTIATLFLTPAHTGVVVWGAGPSLLPPHRDRYKYRSGQMGLGSFARLCKYSQRWGSIATAVQNIWSLRGNSQRTSVNQLQIETSLSYNLPRGWHPSERRHRFSADWTQSRGDRWLVPFGGGIGRTLEIGKKAGGLEHSAVFQCDPPSGSALPEMANESAMDTAVSARPRGVQLCFAVHHTDSVREFAYDASSMGKLEVTLTEALSERLDCGGHEKRLEPCLCIRGRKVRHLF